MSKISITLYSKENCSLCDKGLAVLERINTDIPLDITIVDIYQDDALLEKYQIVIPVVEIDGKEIDYGILSETKIRNYLYTIIK